MSLDLDVEVIANKISKLSDMAYIKINKIGN